MQGKYRKGQKVKIIEVKDKQGNLKYPEIGEYIDRTGTIMKGFDYRMNRSEKIEHYPSYVVKLDDGEMTKIPVHEEAIREIE